MSISGHNNISRKPRSSALIENFRKNYISISGPSEILTTTGPLCPKKVTLSLETV